MELKEEFSASIYWPDVEEDLDTILSDKGLSCNFKYNDDYHDHAYCEVIGDDENNSCDLHLFGSPVKVIVYPCDSTRPLGTAFSTTELADIIVEWMNS